MLSWRRFFQSIRYTRWQAEEVSPSAARDFHAAEACLLREAARASMSWVRAETASAFAEIVFAVEDN
jgi:hypothetical protein